jgi:hypothetical protein
VVTLAHQLGGQLLDYVYVKAKVADVESAHHSKLDELEGEAKEFFESNRWRLMNGKDYEFYQMADERQTERSTQLAGKSIRVNETHSLPHAQAMRLYGEWQQGLQEECGLRGVCMCVCVCVCVCMGAGVRLCAYMYVLISFTLTHNHTHTGANQSHLGRLLLG